MTGAPRLQVDELERVATLAVAVDAGLADPSKRALLLGAFSEDFKARLAVYAVPRAQLVADIAMLNSIEAAEGDGELPLVRWLRAAAWHTEPRPVAREFREAAERLRTLAAEGGARRRWQWRCTVESAHDGVVSVLAVVETALASALFYWIAVRFGTWHLTAAAVIAPFLLLQTERSVKAGFKALETTLDLLGRVINKTEDLPEAVAIVVVAPLLVIPLALATILARLAGTVWTLLASPLLTIQELPRNWWRNIASRDSGHPPEPMPGYQRNRTAIDVGEEVLLAPGEEVLNALGGNAEDKYLAIVFLIPLILPSIVYRWSLKGSALLYLPFVWIARTTHIRGRARLLTLVHAGASKAARLLAVFTLLLVGSKLLLGGLWIEIAAWFESRPLELLETLLAPAEIPLWQLASFTNAILAWLVYFVASGFLARHPQQTAEPSRAFDDGLSAVMVLRGCLSVYAIVVSIYLVAGLEWSLPPIGESLLPPGLGDWLWRS